MWSQKPALTRWRKSAKARDWVKGADGRGPDGGGIMQRLKQQVFRANMDLPRFTAR